jgi:glycosyltransferase involved in cell wall biosynthesis
LTKRKNVLRLAAAFEAARSDGETLTLVGDGPLRSRLEGRPGIEIVGSVPHHEIPTWIAGARVVCQPSLIEPFGQALLEAMACGRAVVATRVGGPPEFVSPTAGVLIDPTDEVALADALRRAATFPCPNEPGVAAAADHDVRRQVIRIEAILERAARA